MSYIPKILYLDIETTPILAYVWQVHEAEVLEVVQHSHLLSFAYQWEHENKIHVVSLRQFPNYKPSEHDDRKLCESLWKLLDEADVVVGQNVDEFDIKKINARFLFHRMDLPSPYQTADTLKINRGVFGHPSNKLDDVCQYHGIGRKLPHTGKDLWFGCMQGNEKDWKLMEKYNMHDIYLLRELYLLLRPWAKTHPNRSLLTGENNCPRCGSKSIQHRGARATATRVIQRLKCMDCRRWFDGESEKLERKVYVK